MRAKLTLDQFKKIAVEKHGFNYDYSLSEYQGLSKKVKISCAVHGVFEQYAGNHLKGNGCPKCKGKDLQKTFDQFLQHGREKYNDQFDYSLIDAAKFAYTDSIIDLVCRDHGKITTSPRSHIHSRHGGCLACGKRAQATAVSTFDLNQWIEAARQQHGNKYNYSLVPDQSRMRENITIICPDHGQFTATPTYHLKSKIGGCKKCYTKSQLMSFDDWVSQCRKVHDYYYDYSKVVYTGYLNKVEIICPKHDVFWQSATDHKAGAQCPRCAKGGSSYAEQKWLTSMGIPNDPEHRQVWITLFDGQKIKVDGYDKSKNTVYEYLGDYYHGNPKIFKSEDATYFGKTFGQLYNETVQRLDKIQKTGYHLSFVWASDLTCCQ